MSTSAVAGEATLETGAARPSPLYSMRLVIPTKAGTYWEAPRPRKLQPTPASVRRTLTPRLLERLLPL